MDLTASHFNELLIALERDSAGAAPEPRQEPRIDAGMQATVVPLALCDSIPATVTVRDLSRAGIGILSPQPLALDQQFVLLLPQADDSPALVLCAVAFWQPVARGAFAIGARFVRILRDSIEGLPINPQGEMPDTSLKSPLRRSA
jgi:hypothetical protein